jgi:uracil-DNA glycosylase
VTDPVALAVERSRVRSQILDCQLCTLRQTTTSPVPFRGPAPSRIAFIGEAPGATETKQLRPFVGRSGQHLDSLLAMAGLGSTKDWYICNSIACRPPRNETPTPDQIRACNGNLRAQIQLSGAEWVVPLGNAALAALGVGLKEGISTIHGRPFEVPAGPGKGRLCLPTFHPSAVLRNAKLGPTVASDLSMLRQFVDGDLDWHSVGWRVGRGKLWPLGRS